MCDVACDETGPVAATAACIDARMLDATANLQRIHSSKNVDFWPRLLFATAAAAILQNLSLDG